MNGYSREVLRECLPVLIENVQPEDGLLLWLYARRWVSAQEKERVRFAGSPLKQMAELIDVLSTKDDGVIAELVSFLKQQGGQARILDQLDVAMAKHEGKKTTVAQDCKDSTTDFPLTYTSAHKVATILNTNPNILNNWSVTMRDFLTKAVDLYDVGGLIKDRQITDAIRLTLEKWISVMGPDTATFNKLVGILEAHDQGAAESLKKERARIRGDSRP